MSLVIIRHNQREHRVPFIEIDLFRQTDPKNTKLGIIVLKSGRELLCSDMPYAIAQYEVQYQAAAAERPRSVFEALFGK